MEFEAYRLIQYTSNEGPALGNTFGSLSNSLNFAAAHFTGNVFRKVAVIHFNELYSDVTYQILQKSPLSLLVILPSPADYRQQFDSARTKIWEDIQQKLATESIAVPVYFAYETQSLLELHEALKLQAAQSQSFGPERGFSRVFSSQAEYMMVLNLNEPKALPNMNLDVIYVSLSLEVNLEFVGTQSVQRATRPQFPEPYHRHFQYLRCLSHLPRTLSVHGSQWQLYHRQPPAQQDLLLTSQ